MGAFSYGIDSSCDERLIQGWNALNVRKFQNSSEAHPPSGSGNSLKPESAPAEFLLLQFKAGKSNPA
jgi:hypothetical protein